MTNRLELNWKLDGFVDEQRYYCSETAIDPLNLPLPKAILASDVRAYVDTDIDEEKTYYVAVSSVRNLVEKLSTVKSLVSENLHVFMPLTDGLNNYGKSAISSINNGATFGNDGAIFDSFSEYIQIETPFLDFASNYKISFEIIVDSFSGPGDVGLIVSNSTGTWDASAKNFGIGVTTDINIWVTKKALEVGIANVFGLTDTMQLSINTSYVIRLERVLNVVRVYVDDALRIERTTTEQILNTQKLRLGSVNRYDGGFFRGKIKNLKVYDVT